MNKYSYFIFVVIILIITSFVIKYYFYNYESFDSFDDFYNQFIILGGNKYKELPELKLAFKHIEKTDQVLEIGANIGRSSVVINSLLLDKTKHVAVETIASTTKVLQKNKEANNSKFVIFNGAISDKPLIQKHWRSKIYDDTIPIAPGWVKIESLSLPKFLEKFNSIKFNTIFADCEGALVDILNTNKFFLSQINKIILEHDFDSKEDIEIFYNLMKEYKFLMIDHVNKEPLGLKNWSDGVHSDPIFVSVWKKKTV
jgi:FkbM family methyltransferase